MKSLITVLVFCVFISGCAYYSLVPPERISIGELYSVEPRISWNRAVERGIETWTIDGPLMQCLRFVTLKEGEALIPSADKNAKLPRFKSYMTPSEILEFFTASLKSLSGGIDTHRLSKGIVDPTGIRSANLDASSVEAGNLRPASFGSLSGFRFDFQFLSKDGLEREGLAFGAVNDGKLLLIVYTGTREYYFDRYKEEVESIIASLQVRK